MSACFLSGLRFSVCSPIVLAVVFDVSLLVSLFGRLFEGVFIRLLGCLYNGLIGFWFGCLFL